MNFTKKAACICLLFIVFIASINGCSVNRNANARQIMPGQNIAINGNAIVNYRQNGSFYVTKQKHKISPSHLKLEITSNEPKGTLDWTIHANNFTMNNPDINPMKCLHPKVFSLAILYSMSYSVNKLDIKGIKEEDLKIEGQWYKSYNLQYEKPTVSILQNVSSGKFELVKIEDSNTIILAKNYNYWFNNALGISIPRKIDVFDITKGLSSKQLLVQIEYEDWNARKS